MTSSQRNMAAFEEMLDPLYMQITISGFIQRFNNPFKPESPIFAALVFGIGLKKWLGARAEPNPFLVQCLFLDGTFVSYFLLLLLNTHIVI